MDDKMLQRLRARRARLEAGSSEVQRHKLENSSEKVEEYLASAPDAERVERLLADRCAHYVFEFDVNVSETDIEASLQEIRGKVTEREFEDLMQGAKQHVLDALIKPFGLGKVLFQDQGGGNVTTVRNANNDVFATESDRMRWYIWKETQVEPFDRKPYERGFSQRRKKTFQQEKTIKDGYTGSELPRDGRTHIDHVVSAKELHNRESLGLYFSEDERVEIATSDNNSVLTDGSLNQSKGENPLREWMNKESKDGKSNAERFGVNKLEARRKDLQARVAIDVELVKEVSGRVTSTGAVEGARMGVQQAIGLLLYELASGLIAEARDLFKQWKGDTLDRGVLRDIKERFHRIGGRLVGKWDAVLKAFVEGSISGFVSNLVTFVVNSFLTTLKRVVRIIREGTLSLLRAFRMLLFPSEGMTRREAAHEASKIFAAGLAVAAGLGIEEFVSKSLMAAAPFIAPFADMLATVIVGILTGIGSAILVYLLDRIDFFGVVKDRRHAQVMANLERISAYAIAETEEHMRVFDVPEVPPSMA